MDYFAHPYVSNSDLTKMAGQYVNAAIRAAWEKGTLVHALTLEPHRVDPFRTTLDGKPVPKDDLEAARKMKDAVMSDTFCRDFIGRCKKEVEMYNANTPFHFEGKDFALDTRRKYDLWDGILIIGGDLKMTDAETQAQFEAKVKKLDYDRARVFYAAGSGAKRDVLIGVSRINYKVFKVFMQEGCPLWRQGADKMNRLAFQYWTAHPPF